MFVTINSSHKVHTNYSMYAIFHATAVEANSRDSLADP